MKSKGNGNPITCAYNLLKISRGEIPFDRVKGLDKSVIDNPIVNADSILIEDARWIVETYEPRVEIVDISILRDNKNDLKLDVKLKYKGVI